MVKLAAGAFALMVLSSHTYAQPTRPVPGGVLVTVPERVELRADGSVDVVVREVGPVPPESVPDVCPKDVPVFTIGDDGSLLPGAYFVNASNEAVAGLLGRVVDHVYLDNAGEYRARMLARMHDVEFVDPNVPGPSLLFPPGHRQLAVNSATAPIRYRTVQGHPVPPLRAPLDISFTLVGAPPADQAAIINVLFSVRTRFMALLAANRGLVHAEVRFEDLGPPVGSSSEIAARTDISVDDLTWTQYAGIVTAFALADSESEAEVDMYLNFPPGNSVNVVFANNAAVPVGDVYVATSLNQRFGVPAPSGYDFSVTVNTRVQWDYTPRNKARPGFFDFEELISHEVMHGLGFNSMMERTNPTPVHISALDAYRLSNSALPNGWASLIEFQTLSRMLQTGTAASSIVYCSPGGRKNMSTGRQQGGDGFGGQHWKSARLAGAGQYIGLMDPEMGRHDPGYLTTNDKRALDIIGWNIDLPAAPPAPLPPANQAPPNQQPGVNLTPTLTWTQGQYELAHPRWTG